MFLFYYLAPPEIYERFYPVFKETLLSINVSLDSSHDDPAKEGLKKDYQIRRKKIKEEYRQKMSAEKATSAS